MSGGGQARAILNTPITRMMVGRIGLMVPVRAARLCCGAVHGRILQNSSARRIATTVGSRLARTSISVFGVPALNVGASPMHRLVGVFKFKGEQLRKAK